MLSTWLLQLRRVQRSSIHLARQQLVDGFGKYQLDFSVVLISFWQLSEYLLQFSASLVAGFLTRSDFSVGS